MSRFFLLAVFVSFPAAAGDLTFVGDFESGKILDIDSARNGFFVHTLPDPQKGSESVSGKSSDFGPNSGLDTRIVDSDVVKGQLVKPRAGKFFLRSALYYDKDYGGLNGGKNKPRSKIYVNGHGVPFDTEGYLGFSIFLPTSWEDETGVRGDRGSTALLQVQSHGASWTVAVLRIYVPKGDTESHWFLEHRFSDTSVKGGRSTDFDLGRVRDDLGKWTDFSLHYRFNPFSTRTNAKVFGGKDHVYEGNKGILQLYKSAGPADSDGNREMELTAANLVNQPVGLVPHPTADIHWHFRIYKYGWHNNPTDVKGPVWVGFDEIRDGRADDLVSIADVLPGVFEPNEEVVAAPLPPTGLSIAQ